MPTFPRGIQFQTNTTPLASNRLTRRECEASPEPTGVEGKEGKGYADVLPPGGVCALAPSALLFSSAAWPGAVCSLALACWKFKSNRCGALRASIFLGHLAIRVRALKHGARVCYPIHRVIFEVTMGSQLGRVKHPCIIEFGGSAGAQGKQAKRKCDLKCRGYAGIIILKSCRNAKCTKGGFEEQSLTPSIQATQSKAKQSKERKAKLPTPANHHPRAVKPTGQKILVQLAAWWAAIVSSYTQPTKSNPSLAAYLLVLAAYVAKLLGHHQYNRP